MKRFQILILLSFIWALSVYSQTIFHEEFESNPFLENDISTEYTFAGNENCLDESYIIGNNLNSVCSDHPSSPNPNGNCLSVREQDGLIFTTLYKRSNLSIPPGTYWVSFSFATITEESGSIPPTSLKVSAGGADLRVFLLDYGTEWKKRRSKIFINEFTTEIIFTSSGKENEHSFAIDDIKMELECYSNPGKAYVNSDPGPVHQNKICYGPPIYANGESITGDSFELYLRKREIGAELWWAGVTKEYLGIPYNGSVLDLTEEFNIQPNYEYKYRVRFHDQNICWVQFWSPQFQVLDCCDLAAEIEGQVQCLNEGQAGRVMVALDDPLDFSMIESISSTDNQYIYVNHSEGLDSTKVEIEFISNGCSCTGNPINFEIYLEGCPDPIVLQTEPIPCCSNNCDDLEVDGIWELENCLIVNGEQAYHICFDFESVDPILNILPLSAPTPCNNTFSITQWNEINNIVSVCGYLTIPDFDCLFNTAEVIVEKENSCCYISIPFNNILEECPANDCLNQEGPNIESIYNYAGGNHAIEISIPGAADGEIIMVTNNKTGLSNQYAITNIQCGPFAVTRQGERIGGISCNGIRFVEVFDCDDNNSEEESSYDLTIEIGDCSYVLVGDYCDEFIFVPPPIGPIQGLVTNNGNNNIDLSVYPNPITNDELLNVEFLNVEEAKIISTIKLFNLQGKLMFQKENVNTSNYQIKTTSLNNGLYIIQVETIDKQFYNKQIQVFR